MGRDPSDGFNCQGKDCEDIADAFLLAAYAIQALIYIVPLCILLCSACLLRWTICPTAAREHKEHKAKRIELSRSSNSCHL